MDFIINNILDRKDQPFSEIYNFLTDRTRSIRQDFTYQNEINNQISLQVHEQIARFHIFLIFIKMILLFFNFLNISFQNIYFVIIQSSNHI